jgi:hypothetical protein
LTSNRALTGCVVESCAHGVRRRIVRSRGASSYRVLARCVVESCAHGVRRRIVCSRGASSYRVLAGCVVVARRTFNQSTLSVGTWLCAYVNFNLASGADPHNVISMAVSPNDGRLHVAIGLHDGPPVTPTRKGSITTKTVGALAFTWRENLAWSVPGTTRCTHRGCLSVVELDEFQSTLRRA